MSTPSPETGKQRASRIPLDYFKHSNRLDRGKLLLALLAAVVAGGVSLSLWSADGRQRWHAPGPVAAVHAAWENDCNACHIPFAPIRDDAWMAATGAARHAADERCAACHRGPVHHATESTADVRSCSACHEEHRGRDASLVRVADQFCIDCHIDLGGHRAPAATASATGNRATDFELDHPEFRSIRADPGQIKFSHRLHMTRGLAAAPDDRGARRLGDLAPLDRHRYRLPGQHDSDLVQLECRSCHRFDRGDPGAPGSPNTDPATALETDEPSGPARADGRRALPIRYENHCRACHPLTLDPALIAASYAPNSPALLPHRLHPAQMATLLKDHYALEVIESDPRLWDGTVSRPTPDHPQDAEQRSGRQLLDEKVAVAAAHVQHECGKCHEFNAAPPMAGGPNETPISLQEVVPAGLPEVWYAHAEFNHVAHTGINCLTCHARASAADPAASDSSRDVLIPGRDTCLRCHSRPRQTESGPAGGARMDCVECHRYHNGDRPGEGLGAEARGAVVERTLPGFLHPLPSPPGEPGESSAAGRQPGATHAP